MIFRKSTKLDVKAIMRIINQAQEYLKSQGINQWQNNYPNEDVINDDIAKGESYVLEKDGNIVATSVISFNKEKTYKVIHDGKWLTNGEYAVIHRIAVDNTCKGAGVAHKIIEYAEEMCKEKGIHSIKVDTHRENLSMQKMLKKNGFEYCWVIYLADGAERVAFEKNF